MYRKLVTDGRSPSLLIGRGGERYAGRKALSRRAYWKGLLELFAQLRWRCP